MQRSLYSTADLPASVHPKSPADDLSHQAGPAALIRVNTSAVLTETEFYAHHSLMPEIRGIGHSEPEAVTDLIRRLDAATDWACDNFHRTLVEQACGQVRRRLLATTHS